MKSKSHNSGRGKKVAAFVGALTAGAAGIAYAGGASEYSLDSNYSGKPTTITLPSEIRQPQKIATRVLPSERPGYEGVEFSYDFYDDFTFCESNNPTTRFSLRSFYDVDNDKNWGLKEQQMVEAGIPMYMGKNFDETVRSIYTNLFADYRRKIENSGKLENAVKEDVKLQAPASSYDFERQRMLEEFPGMNPYIPTQPVKTESEKLQALATRGVQPVQTNMNLAKPEKTIEDLYLEGKLDKPKPAMSEAEADRIDRDYHTNAIRRANAGYAQTQSVKPVPGAKVELPLPEPPQKSVREEEIELPQTPEVAFVHEEGRVDEERVVTSTYSPKPVKKVGLPDESELIFILGGGLRNHTYPGSLGKQVVGGGEIGIGWAGKFGALAVALSGSGRSSVHFSGEEEILPNRTARWTEDYAGILSGRIALEYHTPHLGPLSFIAGVGVGADAYTRGKEEQLWKYDASGQLIEADDPVITPPVSKITPHLSIYGGPKLRITDWLELNANVGYDFDFIRGDNNKVRLVGKGFNGNVRAILSPPSRYNKNR